MNKHKKAFTLVELIVVITIIAILGTIAFISLQGYSQDARNSVRISDISKIKTSLELFQLDAGKYPDTTDPTNITYSGAIVWTQGTFGETTFSSVSKLDKIPTDPIIDRKYVYSVTNTKQEYQLAGIMEGDEVTGIFNQTNASLKTAILKISGNYNGKLLKISTGGTDYVLAMPSLVTSSGTTVEQIVADNLLAYNGYKNLPAQYAGSSYEVLGDSGINLVNISDLVVFSGSLATLSDSTQIGIDARKNFIIKLQNAYLGTVITSIGEIAQIINTQTTDSTATEMLSSTMVSNNLGGSIIASVTTVNACVTQPEYTGATYKLGTATESNQAWQSSNVNLPCYWTCGAGKVLDENTCISESCSGTTPDGTAKVSNATSFAGGTWIYNTTPGKCTYSCGTLHHTEDNNTCISNTKSCAITHGIGEQTRNGTSRGACTVVSCTDLYTGTSCEIAPILTYQQQGLCNEPDIHVPTGCTQGQAGCYLVASCNVGTTIAGTGSTSYGHYFQWGRNKGFSVGTTNQSTRIPKASYDPNNDTYLFALGGGSWADWIDIRTDTLWGGTGTGTFIDMKGPCPDNYHIPSQTEWVAIVAAGGWASTSWADDGIRLMNALKLPMMGGLGWTDGNASVDIGIKAQYYLSSRHTTYNYYSFFTNIYSGTITTGYSARANAFPVRCLKN